VTTPWEIHLAPEAESALREASRSGAAEIAAALDALTRQGPALLAIEQDGPAWVGHLPAGDRVLTIAGRAGDARLVVVSISLTERHDAPRAVDALPLPVATRRRLEGFDLDLRYTLRVLRRSPLFAAVVIATLAIGFGGATALLDIVRTVYAGALPFGDGDRLLRLRNINVAPGMEARRYNLTPRDVDFLRNDRAVFTDVVAMGGRSMSLLGDGPAERVSAIGVSPRWTATLRIQPALGRTFTPEEELAGTNAGVGLISHALWQRRFGGDSAVLGKRLDYDGGSLLVIGVMPRAINYPYDAAVWTPWTFNLESRASSLNVVARLADGVSLDGARSAAATIHQARFAAGLNGSATGYDVATVRADFIRDEGRTIQALTVAVVFLLILACVNVANLLVARFTARRAELGVRAALGGRRDQQVRQLVLETVLLFATGALGGLGLAVWLRRLLAVTIPDDFTTELGFGANSIGAATIAGTVVLGGLTGLLVGFIVSRRAVRADLNVLIRQGGRGSLSTGDRRMFDTLVGLQLSLSLALLAGASLLIGRFRDLSTADPGYDLAGVWTMRVTLEQERYRAGDARNQLVRRLEERLAAVPGVEAVGITTVNPLCCGDWGTPIEVEGRPISPGAPATLVAHSYVSAGYLGVMAIPIRRGTGFEPAQGGGPLTVVINESFARMAWPGEDPIGKRVRSAAPDRPWRTVIGVVPDLDHEAEMRAAWYLPYQQDPTGASTEQLHIMTRWSAGVSVAQLQDVVREVDPALPVYGVSTMEALQRDRRSQDRLGAVVAGVFAVFGLVLAGFSLYGLLSYSVELRRGEMGLRMALGAHRRDILSLVLRQAGMRLAAGALAGLLLSLLMNQGLRAAIDGLPWVGWRTMAGLLVVMLAVTVVAAVAPALQASRADPVLAMRA
jgi:predicted permease